MAVGAAGGPRRPAGVGHDASRGGAGVVVALMDLRCTACGVEYRVASGRVAPGMTRARCARCGAEFPLPRDGAPGPGAAPRWTVCQPGGTRLAFQDLGALQQWIVQGKVARTDAISSTGQVWTRLGDIVELAPLFQAADAGAPTAGRPATRVVPAPAVPPVRAVAAVDGQAAPEPRARPHWRRAVAIVVAAAAVAAAVFLARGAIAGALGW